jgi:RNA polymerase-binding transcription factor DksA
MMGQLRASQVTSVKRALDAFEAKVRVAMHAALMESRKESYADIAGEVHDLGDESVADELLALNSELAERHSHELLEIERARQRIADGEAGNCVDCAGDIAVERLIANPVAERCIDCESRHERTHAHVATPRL